MSSQPPPYAAPNLPSQVSEPPKLGFVERLTNIFFSPSETYADVNRAPKPIAPILVIMLATVLFSLIANWRIKPDYHQMVVNQIEQQLAVQGKTMDDIPENQRQGMQVSIKIQEFIFKYRAYVFPIFTPIFLLIIALMLWVGTLLLQCKTTYLKVFSVAAWASVPTSIVRGMVSVLGSFVRTVDPADAQQVIQGGISSNLGPLVPKSTSIVLHALLEQMDVFLIWTLILTAIGLAAISYKKKTSQTAVIPFGIWGIAVLLRLAAAVLFKF
jgi:Yip1 domain.